MKKKVLVLIVSLTTIASIIWAMNYRFSYPDTYEVKGFEFVEQPDGITCGPTSALMLLRRYGKDVSLEEIKSQTKTKWFEYKGKPIGMTSPDYIAPAMKHFGVGAKSMRGNLDRLKYFVSQNRPPIVLLRSSKQTWHYVVVIGYTEEVIIIADPGPGKRKKLNIQWFMDSWDFTHDMYGRSTKEECGTCGGTGQWIQSINLGPFSSCEICSGTGKTPDMLVELLRLAEVNTRTMIVPSIDIPSE